MSESFCKGIVKIRGRLYLMYKWDFQKCELCDMSMTNWCKYTQDCIFDHCYYKRIT